MCSHPIRHENEACRQASAKTQRLVSHQIRLSEHLFTQRAPARLSPDLSSTIAHSVAAGNPFFHLRDISRTSVRNGRRQNRSGRTARDSQAAFRPVSHQEEEASQIAHRQRRQRGDGDLVHPAAQGRPQQPSRQIARQKPEGRTSQNHRMGRTRNQNPKRIVKDFLIKFTKNLQSCGLCWP